jgi:hypothetical protein
MASTCFSSSTPTFGIHPQTENYLLQVLSKKDLLKGQAYDIKVQRLFSIAISAAVSTGLEKEAQAGEAELKKMFGEGIVTVLTDAIKVENDVIKKSAGGCVVS